MGKIEVSAHGEVAGYYTLVTDKRGVIAEFPNLITDGGLNRMGSSDDWLSWCQVGSGTSAPNVSDTALASRVAATSTKVASINGAQSSAPYFTWRRNTYRFATGDAAGNLAEVGVGWSSTGSLFSRARILDSGGSPTTITVQPDETLDVIYEFRYYPKTTDDTGTVTLTGNIGGTYDWIMRAANVSNANSPAGWGIGGNGISQGYIVNNTDGYAFFDGDIGSITSSPSGAKSFASEPIVSAYSNNSLERSYTVTAALGQANFGSGIRSLLLRMGIGSFQFRFGRQGDDATIAKTSNDVLSIVIKHSWARRP